MWSERLIASSRSWVTSSTLMCSRSTSDATSWMTRVRTMLDLPEPDGPTRLTNWPSPTTMLAPSSTGSPPYDIVRAETRRLLAPDDGRVVQSGDGRVSLYQASDDEALRDASCRGEIDPDRFGVERVAVARDDFPKLLGIEARRHLLGQRGGQLIAAHRAQRLECFGKRAGELDHLGLAPIEFLATHANALEFVMAAQIPACIAQVHSVDQHASAGPLQERQRRLLHPAGIDLSLPQRLQAIDPHGPELHLACVGP